MKTKKVIFRRQFARTISSRIFNDTRNLLIIIDREQTERVQVSSNIQVWECKIDSNGDTVRTVVVRSLVEKFFLVDLEKESSHRSSGKLSHRKISELDLFEIKYISWLANS